MKKDCHEPKVLIDEAVANVTTISNTFYVKPFEAHEVVDCILSLKPKRSTDHYEMSNWFLKIIKPVLVPYLYILFNRMLEEENIPVFLKIAKEIPLHKNKIKNEETN